VRWQRLVIVTVHGLGLRYLRETRDTRVDPWREFVPLARVLLFAKLGESRVPKP
jgi:hypothetical protein